MLGSPCIKPGACGPDALCDKVDLDGVGTCRTACDPFGASLDCPEAMRCVWVGERSETTGACYPAGPGNPPGKECDMNNPCRVDLICAGSTQTNAVCRQDCAASTETGKQTTCSANQVCAPLVDDQGKPRSLGVCAASGEGLAEVMPAPTEHEINFAAKEVSLPQVKPYEPPTDSGSSDTARKASQEETGCQSRGRSPSSGLPVMILLVAGAAILCRRRASEPANPRSRYDSSG